MHAPPHPPHPHTHTRTHARDNQFNTIATTPIVKHADTKHTSEDSSSAIVATVLRFTSLHRAYADRREYQAPCVHVLPASTFTRRLYAPCASCREKTRGSANKRKDGCSCWSLVLGQEQSYARECVLRSRALGRRTSGHGLSPGYLSSTKRTATEQRVFGITGCSFKGWDGHCAYVRSCWVRALP